MYYAPEWRSFQPHAYLGLYNHQSIVAIDKIDKIVRADLIDGELEIYSDHQDLRLDERERIKQAILQAPKHCFEICYYSAHFACRLLLVWVLDSGTIDFGTVACKL